MTLIKITVPLCLEIQLSYQLMLKLSPIDQNHHCWIKLFKFTKRWCPNFTRYGDTSSRTFQNFPHIFISHTYRTMKSSFLEFREKVERGYQNTCKNDVQKFTINHYKNCPLLSLHFGSISSCFDFGSDFYCPRLQLRPHRYFANHNFSCCYNHDSRDIHHYHDSRDIRYHRD